MTTSADAIRRLGRIAADLVTTGDVTDTLATVLDTALDLLSADAAGILVDVDGRLELLAASSHAAAELELHQAQDSEGPCVDAFHDGAPVSLASSAAIVGRWPAFGAVAVDAGFAAVHASPLRWHETSIGAMGVFRRADLAFDGDDDPAAQVLADIATLVIVHARDLEQSGLRDRVREALEARVAVEVAKGVLADREEVDMETAYRLLLRRAADEGTTLSQAAGDVVAEAQKGHRRG